MTNRIDLFDQVTDGYADNNGVAIHYVTMGSGPLMILIHGFPEFWYSWRHQLSVLAQQFQVVAVDLRGYNLSDKPKGVEQYKIRHLVSDIVAVIHHFDAEWVHHTGYPQPQSNLAVRILNHPQSRIVHGRDKIQTSKQRLSDG